MSVFSIGALVGGLLSGLLSDFAGRKVTLVIGASLCSLGGAVLTSSLHLWSERFYRFGAVKPLYLASSVTIIIGCCFSEEQ